MEPGSFWFMDFFQDTPITTPLHDHSPNPFNTLQFGESFTYFSLDHKYEKNPPPGRKEATFTFYVFTLLLLQAGTRISFLLV